jgi:hypothetical protein
VCNAPLVGLFEVDCGEARSVPPCIECAYCDCLLAALPIGTGLLNSHLDLSTRGVSVGNRIGAEGAKALGDALEDNTTLTSLSLNLRGEYSWFRWWPVFLVFFCCKCVSHHWLDCEEPRSILPCIECGCSDFVITLPTVHWNCFAEFIVGFLHSGVSVDSYLFAEGAKVLADALKNNTTLTSLSLDLRCE